MERWQGSVGRSFGPDHGREASGSLRGTRMYEYESGGSSIPREDSKGLRVFGGNNAVSECNRKQNDFDYEYDAITTAVIRRVFSPSSKIAC